MWPFRVQKNPEARLRRTMLANGCRVRWSSRSAHGYGEGADARGRPSAWRWWAAWW
jgi:hypothetical protein